jgi:acetylornithine deacetylase/succinyl-diaminopimelate desuccinylase-like protein
MIDHNYLLATLKKAIQINSVLPHEEALAEFFADEIRKLGLEPEWQVVAKGRPNVYAQADLGPAEDLLLLTGHLDTVDVAANWQSDPLAAVERTGKLYGLGAFDMKSGLVCALTAFKALVEEPARHSKLGKIAFAATVDEEGLGLGAKALLKTHYGKSAGIFLPEPFGGRNLSAALPLGLTGKVLYKLIIKGKMAHGFYPQRGHNAVEAAGKIVAALDRLHLPAHPSYGSGNYATLKIEGGYKEYAIVVPEYCEVVITRLTVPGESRDSVVADMRDLIDSLKLDCSVTIETPPPFYESYEIDTNARLANSFRAAYQATLGVQPKFDFLTGITDANIYVAEGGIPTITYGPNGSGAHECNEYVEIDSLAPVAKIIADSCINYFVTQE